MQPDQPAIPAVERPVNLHFGLRPRDNTAGSGSSRCAQDELDRSRVLASLAACAVHCAEVEARAEAYDQARDRLSRHKQALDAERAQWQAEMAAPRVHPPMSARGSVLGWIILRRDRHNRRWCPAGEVHTLRPDADQALQDALGAGHQAVLVQLTWVQDAPTMPPPRLVIEASL